MLVIIVAYIIIKSNLIYKAMEKIKMTNNTYQLFVLPGKFRAFRLPLNDIFF